MTVAQRFWKSPDPMVQLIPFLDLPSILALAKVEPFVLKMLQRSFIWRLELLGRSRINEEEEEFDARQEGESMVGTKTEQDRREVEQLVEILQMVEDPEKCIFQKCIFQKCIFQKCIF